MDTKEKKRFSIIGRVKSANHAWRGLSIILKTTHNFWGHIFFGLLAIYLGFIFKISFLEWAILFLAIGIVLITEAFNTAIEIDIDLTSPNYHPYAKDTKDVSAGAVLMAVFTALFVGLAIFGPKIFNLIVDIF